MRLLRWSVVGCVAAGGLLAGWRAKEAAAQQPVPSPEVKPADPFAIPPVPDVKPIPLPVPVVSPPPAPPVRYVNKPDLEFDYEISKKGKSGVKAVSLFVRDPNVDCEVPRELKVQDPNMLDGHWRPSNSADNGEPLRYTMPKEGRYEFRLGVTAGNGNASKPEDGDRADVVVVLDITPPTIRRFSAEPHRADTSQVVLTCEYDDDHLGPSAPVVFEYRAGTTGKWSLIEATVERQLPDVTPAHKGDRAIRARQAEWVIPKNAPAEVAVRVTVTDLAGNVAARTIDRLNLDTTVPEGKLTGVRAVEPKPEQKKDDQRGPLPPPAFTPEPPAKRLPAALPHTLQKLK